MEIESNVIGGGQEVHLYLSTACLHGEHDYCQKAVGVMGPKTPATCKFCGAPCVCPCHDVPDRAGQPSESEEASGTCMH